MVKSGLLPSSWNLRAVRLCAGILCLVGALLASASGQASQDFTLLMQPFPSPAAIDPGGTTAASITISPLNGFNGAVDLSCQVTLAATGQAVTSPVCTMSPQSVTPPASATATITTTGLTVPGLYTIAVTATISGTTNSLSVQQNLTVLAVVPQFTITVTHQVEPSSVHAGNAAQGTISINPIYGYVIPSGGVTLSCASVTPLVTLPPTCSFSPNPITQNETSSTLSISTIGPTTTTTAAHHMPFYALWLPLPLLVVAGVGVLRGKRSYRAVGLLALFVLGAIVLLMPACATSTTTTPTNPNSLITPKGNYTFGLSGVDSNGVVSGNTGTSAATVTLTVN